MKPDDFLNSIYLGDRACKAILLDGWRKEVKIQIDAISRVRGETWDFYSAEDVVMASWFSRVSITFPSIRPATCQMMISEISNFWDSKAVALL